MTKDAAQHRSWTFYEVVKIDFLQNHQFINLAEISCQLRSLRSSQARIINGFSQIGLDHILIIFDGSRRTLRNFNPEPTPKLRLAIVRRPPNSLQRLSTSTELACVTLSETDCVFRLTCTPTWELNK
jgi:hypothetical protein